jgi:putative cardiolipin synthase
LDATIARLSDDRVRAGQSGLLLIADSFDAFATRILTARAATHSLDLMYYLWHDDQTGRLLLQEVVKAAERGVKVRMLLDDINPRASDAAYVALDDHPNIELKLFNPSSLRNGNIFRPLELLSRMFALTRRMHTKAWIADGSVAIVGGRNIGNAYFDAADTNFRDLDLLLLGPAVDQTARIFEAYWNCRAARPIHLLHAVGGGKPADIASHIQTHGDTLDMVGDRQSIAEFIAARGDMYWTDKVRVIADPPEKVAGRRRRNWLMKELMPVIQKAGKSLEIVSPYFIPGRVGCKALRKLVEQGVDVTVLTNSLAATDVAAVHGAYSNYRRRLLRYGVKLYELQPFEGRRDMSVFGSKGASLHTKAFAIDDRIGFVGSFNFDPRSVSLNSEMGVLFEDPGLVAVLRRRFEREKSPASSYRVFIDRRGMLAWEGETDDGKMQRLRHEPEAGIFRRLIAGVVRWLPIESQL